MGIYLVISMMVTSVLFFTSKIEQSRIVTIQRPMVITQERKSPAFYVFKQLQVLQKKNKEQINLEDNAPSKYLSNFSLDGSKQGADLRIHVSEMQFNKNEFSSMWDSVPQKTLLVNNFTKKVDSDLGITNKSKGDISSKPIITELSAGARATIKGKLELIDGVGIVDHFIEVKRIEEGLVREIGRIDLKEGIYTIEIESTKGYLIAQIKDRKGLLIGEDRESLVNLQNHGNFYEGPFLRIGPPNTLATNPTVPSSYYSKTNVGRETAAYGRNNNISSGKSSSKASLSNLSVSIFDNRSVLDDPSSPFLNISRNSSTISRIYDPSGTFKNSTSIRYSGEKTETPMFTTKWLDGAVNYISDIQKIEFKTKNGPVIIGRVLVDGHAAADVQVEIETEPGIEAIYLDQFMIPTFTRNSTSENGYFMFIGIEPGNYHIVARNQNKIIGSQFYVAEEEAISFQNISSLTIPKTKVLRTFDAFTSEVATATIVSTDSEEILETLNGEINIYINSENSTSEYLVKSEEAHYLPIRYIQNSNEDYVHVPMIQKTWIEAIKSSKQISELPDTGVIIGFVNNLNYDVFFLSENYDKNNIVYFNEGGQITGLPIKGGGFVIFNAPVGAREVVLQEKESEKIYSLVYNVQPNQISVAHFSAD